MGKSPTNTVKLYLDKCDYVVEYVKLCMLMFSGGGAFFVGCIAFVMSLYFYFVMHLCAPCPANLHHFVRKF